jgi:nicotinate phosphoribosyltransferase
VQVFLTLGGDELDAFRAFADIFPDECVLLVDTLDTLESGVPNAIKVFEELRRKGHEPVGVRLDSGDLAYLSIKVARMLDEAGFPDTSIVLSNQLDELVIWQITTQIQNEAGRYGVDPDKLIKRLVYGVGTNLITSKGASALDGVYKLVSVQDGGQWIPAMKISENREKTLNPGDKNVWRLYDQRNHATADLIGLDEELPEKMQQIMLHHPIEPSKKRCLERSEITEIEPLMEDIILDGKIIYESPSIEQMRAKRLADLERLDHGVKRLVNPHIYHVSLSDKLWQLKQDLIDSLLPKQGNDNVDE